MVPMNIETESDMRTHLHKLKSFLADDTGAVTVDWTVMAASVVGLGLASAAAVRVGTSDLGQDIGASLSAASVLALSYVTNFANPDPSQGGNIWSMPWGYDTNAQYDLGGWERTDGQGGRVQYIRDGYIGVNSGSGGYMMDMHFAGNVGLQNTISLNNGETVHLSFNAVDPRAGRNGNGMDVYFGGLLVGSIDPGAGPSQDYEFELVGGSGNGNNTVELRSRQASYDVLGVWVDDIVIR